MSARDWILRRLISMLVTAHLHATGIVDPSLDPAVHARPAREPALTGAVPLRSRERLWDASDAPGLGSTGNSVA